MWAFENTTSCTGGGGMEGERRIEEGRMRESNK